MIEKAKSDYLINRNVDQMTTFLVEDFNIDITTALSIIYDSEVYLLLKDKTNELYIQSPSYIYELLKKEYLQAKI